MGKQSGVRRRQAPGAAVLGFALALLAPAVVRADGSSYPEKTGVVADVGTGPHLYAPGMGKINIIDPRTLKYQGLIQTTAYNGVWWGQLGFSPRGDRVYTTTTYYSQDGRHDRRDVVKIWRMPALTPAGEIDIPPRQVMSGAARELMTVTADGRWLYLQNATPATSVTVVDLAAGKSTAEIPLPGCWGVYPVASDAHRVAALCGDGGMALLTTNAAGSAADIARSGKLFDVDADPLFTACQADRDHLYFVSFNGNVYDIDVSGKTARLAAKFPLAEGVEGDWKPSGSQLLAFVPGARVLYVLMHEHARPGSQDDPASEVWAVDMRTHKVLSRTSLGKATGIAYADAGGPALFVADQGLKGIVRYQVYPQARYMVRKDKSIDQLEGRGRLEVH